MAELRLDVDGEELTAAWTDDNATTRRAVADALPLDGEATRWGDELYFRTEVDVSAEEAQTEVPVGAIAYWPQGNAICLFWGATPASHETEPRAASPVNVIAIIDDVEPLRRLDGNATVRIEQA
jgi:hypothetical protein